MLLAHGLVDTPTDEDIAARIWFKSYDGMILAVEVMVVTQGAQAASELFLEPLGGGTALGSIAMGQSAAATKFEMSITESAKKRALGSALQLRHNTTDNTLVYEFKVYGVPGWM